MTNLIAGYHEEVVDDPNPIAEVDDAKPMLRKPRNYSCFMCGVSGKNLSDYYAFEHDQRLLHTQKTVLEVLSHLVGKKVHNFEVTTMLCSRCTILVNEGDSVMKTHEKIKSEARNLYDEKRAQLRPHRSNEISIKEESASPQAVEIEVADLDECYEDKKDIHVIDQSMRDNSGDDRSIITYSKRGRKRKSLVFDDNAHKFVTIKSTEEDCGTLIDSNLQFDVSFENDKPKRKNVRGRGCRGRSRGRRGRGRGRGRPTIRSTLIGRGLEGLYAPNNKRGAMLFKGPKIYRCPECNEDFSRYNDLVNHRKGAHTVIDTSILEVEETVLESGVITYFNKDKANSSDTNHPCKDCDKVFLRKDDLSYHHEVSHTDGKGRAKAAFKDKSYICEECGDTFLFKYKLKMHINSKHLNDTGKSANDFTCGECGSKLGSLPGLTFHMRKHHDKVLNYKRNTEYLCSDCGYLATSSKKLKEHQAAHCGYTAKEQVQCEICGKTVLKVSLKMHRVKMHSEFKEQCDRCGERYATKTDLLKHINVVHLNILLYTCKQCGEKFHTSDALRYHRVKVHEKPSFFCHICSKSYKRVGELNTHVKRAHNEKRRAEVCTYCGKEYYDRSGLRNHLVSKHNVPQELTYSDNYLRKKRVDGLPLAKHLEKRMLDDQPKHEMELVTEQHLHQLMQAGQDQQLQQQVMLAQHHHDPPVQHMQGHHHVEVQHHQTLVGETSFTPRPLTNYNTNRVADPSAQEEDSSLVVTEITENSTEQQIIIDPLGNIIHQHPLHITHHQQPHHPQTVVSSTDHHHHHGSHHHHDGGQQIVYRMQSTGQNTAHLM